MGEDAGTEEGFRLSGFQTFRLEQQQEKEEKQGIKEIGHTEKSPCPFCKGARSTGRGTWKQGQERQYS